MSDFDPWLLDVAQAILPTVKPEELLTDANSFLNLVMAKATLKQTIIAQHYFDMRQFRSAFNDAPPGLYFPPSWEFWCMKLYCSTDYVAPPADYPAIASLPPFEYPPELLAAARQVNWYTKPKKTASPYRHVP